MSKEKDSANRLQSINAVLREMLIKDATESLISERFRPLPQRYVERQQMADQFRRERIMQNFAFNQARRDYIQGLRGEREAQRLERGQARWQERFNRGPAQPPEQAAAAAPSTEPTTTPPAAQPSTGNAYSPVGDFRRYVPQYPGFQFRQPSQQPAQTTSQTVSQPAATTTVSQGPVQGGYSGITREENPADYEKAEQNRRDFSRIKQEPPTPPSQPITTTTVSQTTSRPTQSTQTQSSSVRQDVSRKSATSRMAKPAGGF